MNPLHPLLLRTLAEELTCRRRAADGLRSAASQRQGRIDPNPHQIDAVVFALQRIPSGGCILGDEVGLGKTIEAGLVIAQLLAEGKRRILIIAPKPLLGQWQNELYDHFMLSAREGEPRDGGIDGDGIFLMGREAAGSERGARALLEADPFDLCVIDEAHEIFAGIHRRYDRRGALRPSADAAVIASRVRDALGPCPKLLLTATPIQNSLAELWGLVQYIEPTGTLLGDLGNFRAIFTEGDDATLFTPQAEELRRRLRSVLRRTLRRQAEEFLERPFVRRQARLFEYRMSSAERSLLDDVTEYLMEPYLCAFRGSSRRLLLLGFHRRMASSVPALAASLRKVEERLRAILRDDPMVAEGGLASLRDDFASDLEDALDDAEEGDAVEPSDEPPPEARVGLVEKELRRVTALRERAEGLAEDSKASALVAAVRLVLSRASEGGSGKLVIFTESLTTQRYLADLLQRETELREDDITLFRGDNTGPRAEAALARWEDDVGRGLPESRRPSPLIAVRLALVHEFKTSSRVFISTEAGGKGLNLQFCETLVNYDLPWNPQRIEQRIGRCHRYGQSRDVTVINFLARDNEAERLLLDILGRKLELFGTILDASDVVLHEPGVTPPETLSQHLGPSLAASLRRIHERARDAEEVTEEMTRLSTRMDEERSTFEQAQSRARGLIESHLDESVRRHFRRIQTELPRDLARFDRDLARLVTGYLRQVDVEFEERRVHGRIQLVVPAANVLPSGLRGGGTFTIGAVRDVEEADADLLHLGHPLAQAAVERARELTSGDMLGVRFEVTADGDLADEDLAGLRGRRGRLLLCRVRYDGGEAVERVVVTALLEGDDRPLPPEVARRLVDRPTEDATASEPPVSIDPRDLEDALAETLFQDGVAFSAAEVDEFERKIHQIERSVQDQELILRGRRRRTEERFERAREQRDGAASVEARRRAETLMAELQGELDRLATELERLARRDDEHYRKTRANVHARRYAPPRIDHLLSVEFVIG